MTGRRSYVGGWPIAVVGMVLVLLAYTLRYTLVPFVFAGMVGFVLDPVLGWSARRMRGHRWPAALVLSVAAEPTGGEGDASIGALQERYSEAAFKEELPEAVCGESDKTRVKIENFSEIVDGPRLVYTAEVVCAPVRFLQIGERRAAVRYVLAPDLRYRLTARAQEEDFDKQRGTIDAFLASFRVLPGEKPEK
jgi:hypothetical protein